jgi:geranylgeranyl pyrophosphate synthase
MTQKSGEKVSEKIRKTLIQKSAKALTIAHQEILSENPQSKEAQDAIEYYVANWKEAIHPGLIAFTSEAVGGDPEKLLDMQVVMLLFAAAIDLHDDIIDNSLKKGGKFTVFGKFGRDITILLGDAFMIKGFALLNRAEEKLSPEKRKQVSTLIKHALFEVGDAHALELKFKRRWDADPNDYLKVLEKKAAIIEAEAKIGALVGGGKTHEIEALGRYGRVLGLMGALREDFIDIFEVQELSNRIKNECLPIPIMYALRDAKASKEICQILSKKKIKEEDSWRLVDIVYNTKTVKKLREEMLKNIVNALNVLAVFKNSHAVTFLKTLMKSTMEDLES